MNHGRIMAHVLLAAVLLACDAEQPEVGLAASNALWGSHTAGNSDYEVWLVDQSNSNGLSFGGTLYVYDGKQLSGAAAAEAQPVDVASLADATAALCMENTGANPVRPHMIVFNSTHSHGILSFVASGHVVIFDGPTRAPVACLRAEIGAGGARQAHAAFPTAGDQYIVVANQNGKKLERIRTDYATGSFVQEPEATIDLAGCTTPHGAPCQAAGLRPDNAPICPVPLPNGQVVVTLRGGGMFVVDPRTTPMSIVAEYDMDHVSGNGCGGTIVQDTLFITSGGATPNNLYTYEVYALPTSGYSTSHPANTPAPIGVDSDDADHRDAHGVTPARAGLGAAAAKYLWVADRGLGLITTYDALTFAIGDEIHLAEGPHDPNKLTPDLLDTNPVGNLVFASLRGSAPLTGDPHVATGSQAGLAVFQVTENGASGELKAVIPISNKNAAGVELADAHGVQVRRK
jgi:hypothetical protein